ncbi:MAG: homoserine kinase [Anaerolineae bacterium]|nr:homoserine kinase [Anaerolineae bacterium]
MTVKTPFTHADFVELLAHYDLGTLTHATAIEQGTVQTNYVIQTTQGKFVFRHYENRSRAAVLFERDLLTHLTAHNYPCPALIPNRQGTVVGIVRGKPYMCFEFVAGQHIEHPSVQHYRQIVQQAAALQTLTQDFRSPYTTQRWNYDVALCRTLAQAAATKINTPAAREKYVWLTHELTTLDLPPSVPKGICHCDLHFSNVLFQGAEFAALLDFDDANYTFLTFDLVGLIEY